MGSTQYEAPRALADDDRSCLSLPTLATEHTDSNGTIATVGGPKAKAGWMDRIDKLADEYMASNVDITLSNPLIMALLDRASIDHDCGVDDDSYSPGSLISSCGFHSSSSCSGSTASNSDFSRTSSFCSGVTAQSELSDDEITINDEDKTSSDVPAEHDKSIVRAKVLAKDDTATPDAGINTTPALTAAAVLLAFGEMLRNPFPDMDAIHEAQNEVARTNVEEKESDRDDVKNKGGRHALLLSRIHDLIEEAYGNQMSKHERKELTSTILQRYAGKEKLLIAALEVKARSQMRQTNMVDDIQGTYQAKSGGFIPPTNPKIPSGNDTKSEKERSDLSSSKDCDHEKDEEMNASNNADTTGLDDKSSKSVFTDAMYRFEVVLNGKSDDGLNENDRIGTYTYSKKLATARKRAKLIKGLFRKN